MSYCELQIVKNNAIEPVQSFQNSHGGAAYIWTKLYDKYVKNPNTSRS